MRDRCYDERVNSKHISSALATTMPRLIAAGNFCPDREFGPDVLPAMMLLIAAGDERGGGRCYMDM